MSFFRRKNREERAAPKPVPAAYAAPEGPSMRELPQEKREERPHHPEAPSVSPPASAVETSINVAPDAAAVAPEPAAAEPVAETGFPWPPKAASSEAPETSSMAPVQRAGDNAADEPQPQSNAPPPEGGDGREDEVPPFPLRTSIVAGSKPAARKPRTKTAQKRKPKPMTHKPAKTKMTHRNPVNKKSGKTRAAKVNLAPKIQLVQRTKPSVEPSVKAAVQSSVPSNFPSNVQDSRQAFVVLAWFEYLLRRIPARELPYLIDQYRKIGWIDDPLHAWFVKMAEGVGGTRTKAGETQFAKQGARGLVTIHKETLRFLNQLRAAAPRPQTNGNGVGVQLALTHK